MMGPATPARSFFPGGSIFVLFASLFTGVIHASQDLLEACNTVSLDKPVFQGSYQVSPSAGCVLFKFETMPVGFKADDVSKNVYMTIYNVTIAPMYGPVDLDDDEVNEIQKKIYSFCPCSMCAAPLEPEGSGSNLSVDAQIQRSVRCTSAMSPPQSFRLPVGGRVLIIAKKQSSLFAYKLSYRYVYDTVCPNPNGLLSLENSIFQVAKTADWCPGSFTLVNGNFVESQQVCYHVTWLCDGFVDCADGSDESCCAPRYTRCAAWQGQAGKCVPHCNGYTECQLGGTEMDCRLPDCNEPNLSCRVPSDDGYGNEQPEAGGFQCLPANRRCNGLIECAGALDELGCDATNCGPDNGTYLCESDISGRCIRQDYVCDGQPNCPNGDDELYCPLLSRRINIVLCMSGLFSCASVLFVIAYFHRRYCMASRRSRRSHRRRRFDLMSPVEQAARYFMQMCGAPPSYHQVMQMGGPEYDRPESELPDSTIDDLQNGGMPTQAAINGEAVHMPAPTDREVSVSCGDEESTETEYLSSLTFPNSSSTFSNNHNAPNDPDCIQIHAPIFMLRRPGGADDESAEYAECNDDPCQTPGTFATVNSFCSGSQISHIEMTATNVSETSSSDIRRSSADVS